MCHEFGLLRETLYFEEVVKLFTQLVKKYTFYVVKLVSGTNLKNHKNGKAAIMGKMFKI